MENPVIIIQIEFARENKREREQYPRYNWRQNNEHLQSQDSPEKNNQLVLSLRGLL